MTITIRIKTGNAAFCDDTHGEVVRIVREWVRAGEDAGELERRGLMDYNGNRVGSVTVRGK